MAIEIDILDSLRRSQKNAIKSYTVFAIIDILLGVAVIIVAIILIDLSETIKLFIGIGGGVISSISAFPIKEIILRNERIKTYDFLTDKMHDFNDKEYKRIEKMVWKSLEKVM